MPKKRTFREFKQGLFHPTNKEKCLNKQTPFYRSSLERQMMIVLDKNTNIISWNSEETVIIYKHPCKTAQYGKPTYARYFVDFYIKAKIEDTIKEYLIEVKPHRQTLPPTNHGNKKKTTLLYESAQAAINNAKWAAADIFCKKKGWAFIVVTEKNIDQIFGKV